MTQKTINYVDQERQDNFSCKHENTLKSTEFSEGDEQLCLLTVSHTFHPKNHDTSAEKIKLWDSEKCENFVTNLDENGLSSILNDLINFEHKHTIVQQDINSIAEQLSTVLKSAAAHTVGMVKKSTGSYCKIPQWFNRKCKISRKKIHRAKYRYKLRSTNINKLNVKIKSKEYKKTLSAEQKAYKLSNIKQMRKIKKI